MLKNLQRMEGGDALLPFVTKLNFKLWPQSLKFSFRAETKLQTSPQNLKFSFWAETEQ